MGESVWSRRWPLAIAGCGTVILMALAQLVAPDPGSAAGENGSRAGVLIASASAYPDGHIGKKIAVLSTRKRSLNRMWDKFNLPGEPPTVNFERHYVLFAGKGISGSCPEEFRFLERVPGEKLVRVELHTAWGPDCTDDWRGHTFVIGAAHKHFPRGEFELRLGRGKTVTVDRR